MNVNMPRLRVTELNVEKFAKPREAAKNHFKETSETVSTGTKERDNTNANTRQRGPTTNDRRVQTPEPKNSSARHQNFVTS